MTRPAAKRAAGRITHEAFRAFDDYTRDAKTFRLARQALLEVMSR